jgi:UPF0755 protein
MIADLDPQAKTLEGYLFPDTYYFPRHAQPPQIVLAMVSRFREIHAELQIGNAIRSTHEIVTIASLVEEETWVPSEKSLIAGVFYGRLQKGIPLQADPTVAYAAHLTGRMIRKIRRSDLQVRSPYNTYLNRGLPPSPISNPGRAALKAATNPAQTEYLYFVAKADGGHTFSKTLAEHNLAVSLYRQSLEENRGLRTPSLSVAQELP